MKGNSLFIASLGENASIFEVFMSLALKSAWQKRFSSAEKSHYFIGSLLNPFNVIWNLIVTIHLLGFVVHFKFFIYFFSTCEKKGSKLTLVAVRVSVRIFSIHAVYQGVDKQSVRIREVIVNCRLPKKLYSVL